MNVFNRAERFLPDLTLDGGIELREAGVQVMLEGIGIGQVKTHLVNCLQPHIGLQRFKSRSVTLPQALEPWRDQVPVHFVRSVVSADGTKQDAARTALASRSSMRSARNLLGFPIKLHAPSHCITG